VKAFCGFSAVVAAAASAQTYPTRPIAWWCLLGGGPTDTIGRIMAERMGRSLGQTVVVENTTGCRGQHRRGQVARAAPDGYMLSIATSARNVTAARPTSAVRSAEGPQPVAMLATNPRPDPGFKDEVPARGCSGNHCLQRRIRTRYRSAPAARVRRRMSAPSTSRSSPVPQAQIIHYRGAAPAMRICLPGTSIFTSIRVISPERGKG